ncbi:MAG TPA: DUF4199 domain-containing protein [Pyrinomonadaceae bacterium]|nr:DUF4199 domain-containing protein [Pyrinomonadaceae bacterium]
MRIALKYGLLITLGVIVWTITAHLLTPNPTSPVHSLGAGVLFNLLEIAGIFLGVKAKKREAQGSLNFKQGIKTGLSIALVYGLSSCLFFLAVIVLFDQVLLAANAQAQTRPLWQVALGTFGGLFFGALFLGLIYSTITSFILASRKAG